MKNIRNLQEQVLFNSEQIELLKRLALGGIKILGKVNKVKDLPQGELGDAFLVDTRLYIFLESWVDLGEYPKAGPAGPRGEKGEQGERGDVTKITIGSEMPGDAKEGDLHLTYEGKYYEFENGEWLYRFSVAGPKGEKGDRGLTGPQGEKGDQGERGLSSPIVAIRGTVTAASQLPDPRATHRNDAYFSPSLNVLYTIMGNDINPYWAPYNLVESTLALKADKTYVDNKFNNYYADVTIDSMVEGLQDKIEGDLALKVDKVAGKGLSTNDYTNEEKNKVATVDAALLTKADKATTYTQAQVDALLLAKENAIVDSGWLELTLNENWDGWFKVRKIGKVVYWNGKLTRLSDDAAVDATSIPAGYRYNDAFYFPAATTLGNQDWFYSNKWGATRIDTSKTNVLIYVNTAFPID